MYACQKNTNKNKKVKKGWHNPRQSRLCWHGVAFFWKISARRFFLLFLFEFWVSIFGSASVAVLAIVWVFAGNIFRSSVCMTKSFHSIFGPSAYFPARLLTPIPKGENTNKIGKFHSKGGKQGKKKFSERFPPLSLQAWHRRSTVPPSRWSPIENSQLLAQNSKWGNWVDFLTWIKQQEDRATPTSKKRKWFVFWHERTTVFFGFFISQERKQWWHSYTI